MQEYFTITEATIVRFKKHKNGFTILVRESALNSLSKPEFNWIGIWDQKAKAIESKLEKGARFRFSGNVTETKKGKKFYRNKTVALWKALPPKEEPKRQPRPKRDDDWYVPEIRNRDRRSDRLAEGFTN